MIGIMVMLAGCADSGGETGAGPALVWEREVLTCTSDEPRTWAPPPGVRIAALHVWRTQVDTQTNDAIQANATATAEAGLSDWESTDPVAELSCDYEYDTEYLVTWATWEEQ